MKRLPYLLIAIVVLASFIPAQAQTAPVRNLILTGGGFNPLVLAGMMDGLISAARDGQVNLVVVPAAFSTNPEVVSPANRAENLKSADTRRKQIEESCTLQAGPNFKCTVVLAPILVRGDAQDQGNVALFNENTTGVILLGGDASNAMQVLNGSPVEKAIEQAYQRGAVVAGVGAGANILSQHMLTGYRPNFDMTSAMTFGAVDFWSEKTRRGLSFGPQNLIIDSQFYERGRLPRLLNAITLPGAPAVGLGIDTGMGVYLQDDATISRVFGPYTLAILDAETYHAADGVQYQPGTNQLRMRNVLFHTLAPGEYSYDLTTRRHSLVSPPATIERRFGELSSPAGAGPLVLSSNLLAAPQRSDILSRFTNLSGGANARLLVIAAGFARPEDARMATEQYQNALPAPAQAAILGAEAASMPALDDITGVVVVGLDASLIDSDQLASVAAAWRSGMPLLLDGAAAALAGKYYVAQGPTTGSAEEIERAVQGSLLLGGARTSAGLSLVGFNLIARVQEDNRWGKLISLAYDFPAQPAIGLSDAAWLEVTPGGSQVQGSGPVYSLDFSIATLSRGANGGMVIANGLLDVFGAGELLQPESANSAAAPFRAPTPGPVPPQAVAQQQPWMQAPPATPLPAAQPAGKQSPTPVPTATQRFATDANEPTNPFLINLMVLVGLLPLLAVFAGVIVTRRRGA